MLRHSIGTLALTSALGAPAAACPPPVETSEIEVFPSGEAVPENLLRIYVYFPRPMSRGVGVDDVTILDEYGGPIAGVLLANRYDLWSADRTRLTLLLDPGRVKTGLDSSEVLGRALESGRRISLHIPGSLEDQDGCPLGQAFEKSYRVEPEHRLAPDPANWLVRSPNANSQQALVIDVDFPLDHVSLAYRLRVFTEDGELVAGTISILGNEQIWQFKPRQDWSARPYQIRVDSRLEDIAGNRPSSVFDRDPAVLIDNEEKVLTFKPTEEIDE